LTIKWLEQNAKLTHKVISVPPGRGLGSVQSLVNLSIDD